MIPPLTEPWWRFRFYECLEFFIESLFPIYFSFPTVKIRPTLTYKIWLIHKIWWFNRAYLLIPLPFPIPLPLPPHFFFLLKDENMKEIYLGVAEEAIYIFSSTKVCGAIIQPRYIFRCLNISIFYFRNLWINFCSHIYGDGLGW